MADIDVSDLLIDSDFINALILIHRTATVNSMGENVLMETSQSTVGSVQPTAGKELLRLPESLRSQDVRTFYIKAPILSDGASQYPDIISFGGDRFQVQLVMPWLNYGQGWNSGLCVKEKPSS